MKRKLIPLFLTLTAVAAMLFGGCHVNVNITDSGSKTSVSENAKLTPSELQSKLESELNALTEESSETEAKAVTMADIYKLKNTDIFAKNTLEHIFDGTINGKGKATGYHYSKVSDSKGKIIKGTESDTDLHGVFTAKVTVDGVKKNGFSSFYPESWTPQQVVDAINEAYESALADKSNPVGGLWIGHSGDLEIDMYLNSKKKITTAYPIYEGD